MQLQSFLEESARTHPDKTAIVCGNRSLTYEALEQAANRLAHGLIARGVQRGDRVAIYMDNCIETVVSMFAVLKADAVFLIINASTKEEKLAYILNNCRAQALIAPAKQWNRMENLSDRTPHLKTVVVKGMPGSAVESISDVALEVESRNDVDSLVISYDRLIAQNADRDDPPPQSAIDLDLASLIYTSGSTGEPKGVMLTHRNMTAAAASVIEYLQISEDDVTLSVLPLAFGYGLYQVLMGIRQRATVVLERSFAFPHAVLKRMVEHQATCFPMVPTIAAILLQTDVSPYDLSSLRQITNAGAALPVDHVRQFRELLPWVDLVSMYGQTECKRVCYLEPEQIDVRPDSVGKAMPNTEAYIVDETGNRVKPGQIGELVVRGANVMQGYWELPEATERSLRPGPVPGERVLHTGDLFRMDDQGYLYFVSRRDDIIKSRGEKVSPREVENALCEHPAIAEAVVIGRPDEMLGEAIQAIVTLSGDKRPAEKEILRHCATRLEDFMIPHAVDIIDELPKTGNGKVDKKKLKEQYRGEVASG